MKILLLFVSSTGNSRPYPKVYPKEADIFPGFPSDSVEHRPEGATDDFTETGSYAKDKPSANTPSRGTQNDIASGKGLFISCEL